MSHQLSSNILLNLKISSGLRFKRKKNKNERGKNKHDKSVSDKSVSDKYKSKRKRSKGSKSLRDRRSWQRRRSKGICNTSKTLSCLLLLNRRTSSRLLCLTIHHQPSSISCSEGPEMGGRLLTFTLSVTTRDPLSQSSNQRQERSVEDSLVSHGVHTMAIKVTPMRICSQWTIRQST